MPSKKVPSKKMPSKQVLAKKTPAKKLAVAAVKKKADLPEGKAKAKVKTAAKNPGLQKAVVQKALAEKVPVPASLARALDRAGVADGTVLDRLAATVLSRRTADPAISHSARLMARGTAKVAQKFGEEAVECLLEAMTGDKDALVAESADVLYHLVVLWVNAGVDPAAVWEELRRREGISGIAEKARRKIELPTTKIP